MHHVSHQGQQFGPYSVEQINQHLVQGVLDASSHVWDQDANGWIEIGRLPGVILPTQQAQPAPVAPVAPVATAQNVAEQKSDNPSPKSGKKKAAADKLKIVKIVLGLGIGGVLIYFVCIPLVGSALEENKKPNPDVIRVIMRSLVAFVASCWALICVTYPFRKVEKKKKKKK